MPYLLVFLQFMLIGLIAYPFDAPVFATLNMALFGAGIAVFVASLHAMKLKTFTVMPDPKMGGELVSTGIYSKVRHPMYLAVLLCAFAADLAYGTLWKWLATMTLVGLLALKMRYEEKQLLKRFDAYADYRKRTKAIFPFVF